MRILALCLALTACAPSTNTTGTPTNAAEQVAAILWGSYIAADTAWLGVLTSGHATPAAIAAVQPRMQAASDALTAFTAAAVQGTATTEQAAAQAALAALTATLTANGIAVKGSL